jgi:phospholipid/cholesterol/gamma-HCH transport system substrate-binding protein
MRGLLSPLIKLIAFLVVTSFAFYVLAITIANTGFGSTYSYKAEFTDSSGLNVGDDVRVAGVRVGTVTGVKLVHHTTAEVSFTVVRSRSLPTSTIARIRFRNLIGQRYLDITQGAGDSHSVLPNHGVLPTSHTQNALDLTVLFAGFKPLFEGLNAQQINDLSGEIVMALQGEGGSIDLLMGNLADLTNSLADKDQVIGSVIDNLTSVLSAIGSHDTELSDLIVQLQGFISGLSQDRATIGTSIDGINALSTSTAGLLTNVRAPLAKDITDLTALTGLLNRNKPTMEYTLQHLPNTLGVLVRTGSYGSWFNFYLCTINGAVTLPGNATINIPLQHSKAARCQ